MIRNPFSFKLYLIVAFLTFFLSGCFKDDLKDLSIQGWHPEVALPLINADFKVQDILNKFETGGYIRTDEDGLLSLVYTGEIVSVNGRDLYDIPDLLFSFLDKTTTLEFPFEEGEKIMKINLSSGSLFYEVKSSEKGDVQVILKIPAAIKDGISLQDTLVLPFDEKSSQEKVGYISLEGYTLDLTQTGGKNELEMIYEAINLGNNQPVILDTFSGKLMDLAFKFIDGNFGGKSLGEYLDTIKLDVFNNWVQGSIFLEEPSVQIDIKNTFGFPLTAKFTNFSADNYQSSRDLEGEIISEGIECNFPGVPKEGNEESSSYLIHSANSNLQNFLAISPKRISYGFSLYGESRADFSQSKYFVTDTSKLKINLDLEIPLHGRIENVFLVDTFNFEMKQRKRVESADFKLLVENSFPNDAEVQVFFTNASYEKIDSLLTPLKNVFSSAIVDENGFVITPTIEETNIPFSTERYKRLFEVEKILVRVKLVSFKKDLQSVKYTVENGLSVKMGVVVGLTK